MSNDPTRVISESLLFSESVQNQAQIPTSRGHWAEIRASVIMSALEEAGFDVVEMPTFVETFEED